MNATESIIEYIGRTIRNTVIHADTYIQDVFHALSPITDTPITWNEENKTFTLCGQNVRVDSINGVDGTVSFIINGDLKNVIVCPITEKESLMIEALKQMISDEEDRIKSLDENIEKLHRDDAVQNTYVSLYSRVTGLEVDTDYISTNTVEQIIILVRNDLEDSREEKYRIIKELNDKLDKLNKVWEWSLPTPAMWADFDCGTVQAPTYEEAFAIARANLTTSVNEANVLLAGKCTISIDASQITLTEVK
jgi:hypothetical protein